MSNATIQAVEPSNGKYLRFEDIKANAVLTNNVHRCPTRVIVLENTTSAVVVPLSGMVRISSWARKTDIKIHLDGSQLFEAVAVGAGSLNWWK